MLGLPIAIAAAAASLFVPQVAAHGQVVGRGCGGHELIMPRAPVTDVESSKLSLDPTEQCQYYNYAPTAALITKYPRVWDTAQILADDSAARTLFNSINATIQQKSPNTPIRPATLVQGSTYDRSDPDCWWSWQGCTTPKSDLGIAADLTILPEPNTIGLTLDDGPNCSQNALFDYLRQQNQKVSLYYIGSNVLGWPLQALRAFQDGHEICVHTWSHQPMTTLSNEVAFAELYYTRQIIKDVLGVTPTCWRPPQGDVDNRIRIIAQGLGLTNHIWKDDSDDWRAQAPGSSVTPADVDRNYQNVINNAKNGSYANSGTIMLSHQSTNYTMSTFMKWYPELKNAFRHLVPVAVGLNKTQPYVENSVTFPNFASYIAGQTNSSTGPATSASASSASASAPASSSSGSASRSAGASATSGGANFNAASQSATSRAAAGAAVDMGLMKGGMGALVSLCMAAIGAMLVL